MSNSRRGKQYVLIPILLTALPGMLRAQYRDQQPWANYWTPGISSYFKVDDSVSVPLVREMNRYHVMRNALYLTHKIEDAADNRVHLEFHAGGGAVFDAREDTIFPAAFISFKMNLMNPKIPNAHEIMGDIHELRNLSALTGFALPSEASRLMEATDARLTKYHEEFWWKRVSLIFSIPFKDTGPVFDYGQAFLCLGYDLGDIITFQAGMNLHQKYVAMASVDLSTPLYSLADSFKNALARLLRVPRDGSYYGGYD